MLGLYTAVTWVLNLIKLVGCDFQPSFKEEILHTLGVFIPIVSWFTAWI